MRSAGASVVAPSGRVLPRPDDLSARVVRAMDAVGVPPAEYADGDRAIRSPVTGQPLGAWRSLEPAQVGEALAAARQAYDVWRRVPAPVRGRFVRRLGELFREHEEDLATIVAVEAGKPLPEARGEVQEAIDMCDLGIGLSRQLFGRTIASERPGHRMMEQWHPLGVIGVVTAFNFPVAVWSWNAVLAWVCGDAVVWKPSEKGILAALACQGLARRAAAETGTPPSLSTLAPGGPSVASSLARDERVALLSATGSTGMGQALAPVVAGRLGRALFELGGNNAAIVAPSANLDLAVEALTFAAAGTAGQRCTSLRRVIAHRSVVDELTARLARAYQDLAVGSPLDERSAVGPLIDAAAFDRFAEALHEAVRDGGSVVTGGGRVLAEEAPDAYYVRPAIVRMPGQSALVRRETFGPLLYVMAYETLDEAISLNNSVRQGLSSSIFTAELAEAEEFMAAWGSDCGIVNVNIGPSGAEVGGAFGGEKDTGGGRESGSDAWRAYMRRVTNTVNFSDRLTLAQGVTFGRSAASGG